MRDERTFILVHDGIEDHPKIAALSDRAFRVFVTTLGYCSRNTTDGVLRTPVWAKRASKKVRDELEAELVHRPGHTCRKCPPVPEGHVLMHDYLDWQRSSAQIDARKALRSEGGKWGGHRRWHIGKGITDPECGYCNGTLEPPSTVSNTDRSTHSKPNDPPNRTDMGSGYTEVRGQKSYPVETLGGEGPEGQRASARGTRPADRCARHRDDPNPGPCRDCAIARTAASTWETQEAERRAAIREAIDTAIADPRQRCDHGTDGGRHIRPDTGQSATCAQCRAQTTREAS
jgi:hypothetical protein